MLTRMPYPHTHVPVGQQTCSTPLLDLASLGQIYLHRLDLRCIFVSTLSCASQFAGVCVPWAVCPGCCAFYPKTLLSMSGFLTVARRVPAVMTPAVMTNLLRLHSLSVIHCLSNKPYDSSYDHRPTQNYTSSGLLSRLSLAHTPCMTRRGCRCNT